MRPLGARSNKPPPMMRHILRLVVLPHWHRPRRQPRRGWTGAQADPPAGVQAAVRAQLLFAEPEPVCPGRPPEGGVASRDRWRRWRLSAARDMDAALADNSTARLLSARLAVGRGLCVLRACCGSPRTSLPPSRRDAIGLRLRLSWALIVRGDDAHMAMPLLEDALALVPSGGQRRG